MVEETIRLTAHEKFIIDGIKRQAGSVEKAVLELVMNGIESQMLQDTTPKVAIEYSDDDGFAKLVVRDSGRGFKSRTEVKEWFAKFGTPHDECPECKETMKLRRDTFACECGFETEGRTWAEFRMGRGQAFSFGRNVWRTGQFRMEYDLETAPDERTYAKRDGTDHVLDFKLKSGLPNHVGCEVTVYFYKNPVGQGCYYRSLEAFQAAIKHHVEFMEGEITFNGEQINTPASECTWDVETDDAYFMFGKGNNLGMYNIGAYVRDYAASHAGVTGVVVSKDKMRVNFARNDVQHDCEVFERIWMIVRENKIKKIRRAQRRLDTAERVSTLLDLRDGDVEYKEIKSIGLLEMTDGKVMSLDAIRKIRSPWTFATTGDNIADRLMQVGSALCFSDRVLDSLDFSGEEKDFFDWLLRPLFEYEKRGWRHESKSEKEWKKVKNFYSPFNGLSGGYSNTHTIIPSNKLSKAERRFLTVMESYGLWGGRSLCIGISDTANGWTDGSTYIAFSRSYLERWNPQYHSGAAALGTLAFHELAHDNDDTGTHHHNVEFYQAYHELTRHGALGFIGDLPRRMVKQKWQDKASEQAEQDEKRKAARDKKLGVKRVAADGITAKKVVEKKRVIKKRIVKRKRRNRY